MKKRAFFLILLPVLFMTLAAGQKKDNKNVITGVITDLDQRPIKGVAIFIDKQNTNHVSNSSGHYKVKVKKDAKTISALSTVYGTIDTTINGRNEINFIFSSKIITNKPTTREGDNQNINIGYGMQNKNDMGMSVNHVNARKNKYASYTDIYSLIKAEVPGVSVRGRLIEIRGTSSIQLSGTPLFIVDGIQVSSLDNVLPQMVKSIEVLKGAAASIYGSRGANGVILITLIR